MNKQQEKTLPSKDQLRFLKKSAHHLKPIVQIGKKGNTSGLIEEINHALLAHELIKVQWQKISKDSMDLDIGNIVQASLAVHVASIGNTAIFFSKRKKNSKFDL
jgi:RNA-binding protein